ncbi:MAG TPA: glycine cleavage T C-terminal barrel domain-containing protein [Candidatus Polarisedimenticolia bacterium]|nr:glycine cleavage T C-terminal barrel domain-containing protein [Candidatus Polarisedimenticolia bacterium]
MSQESRSPNPRQLGDSCLVASREELGRIRLRGKDRHDFLHRLSTNDILALKPGEGRLTALLNPKGRLLDLLQVLVLEEEMLVITSEGAGEKVLSWLEAYHFREEVEIEPCESDCLGLYGERARSLLARLSGEEVPAVSYGHNRMLTLAGVRARLAGSFPLAGAGFFLLAPSGSAPVLRDALQAAGAQRASRELLEALRVAAGVPAWGRELTEDFNPWEAGLDAAISLAKGCYVGQEIVARIHTYKKLQRRLSGLEIEGSVAPPPGSAVLHESKQVATLTSAAVSPFSGKPIGLAFLPLPLVGVSQTLEIRSDSSSRPARVVSLPFLSSQRS